MSRKPHRRRIRRPAVNALWLYLIGFAVCVGVLFLLPPPYSTLALLVLIAVSILWGVSRLRAINTAPDQVLPEDKSGLRGGAAVIHLPSIARPEPSALPVVAHGNLIAAVFALIAFGLMIAAAIDLRPRNEQAYLPDGSLKLILGGIAIGAAVFLSNRLPPLSEPIFRALDRAERRWWVFGGVGALCMALLAEINGQVLHFAPLMEVSTHVQFLLLLVGCLLVGYGFGGAPPIRAGCGRRGAKSTKSAGR